MNKRASILLKSGLINNENVQFEFSIEKDRIQFLDQSGQAKTMRTLKMGDASQSHNKFLLANKRKEEEH